MILLETMWELVFLDLASSLGPIDIGPDRSLQFDYSHGQRPNASFSFVASTFQFPIRVAIGMVKNSYRLNVLRASHIHR